MSSILVAGGAGFVGSCYVRTFFSKSPAPFVVLDKLTYAGSKASLDCIKHRDDFRFVHGGIEDRDLVLSILRDDKVSAVLNFAAETHVDRSIDDPIKFARTNVLGTCEFLAAVYEYFKSLPTHERQDFRYLQVSTDEVYGSLDEDSTLRTLGFTESSTFAPNSPYAASKASADHFVRSYGQTFGLPVLTTHCSNNFGPFQFPDKLVPLVIQKILATRPIPIYGDGQQIRDWIYVSDHCEAIHQVLEKGVPGNAYNIGAENALTNEALVRMICQICDTLLNSPLPSERLIEFVEDRPGHDRRYAVHTEKIRKQIGWKPMQDFEDNLRSTVAWYLEHQDWVDSMTDGHSTGRRMGLLGE